MKLINSKTKLYCLIGNPVQHSLSPVIYNAAFGKLGINAVYLAFNVSRENLEKAVNGLRSLNVSGFNVTMPYKTSIISLLDGLDGLAEKIGAVNTVKNVDRKLVGYNTDGIGALEALKHNNVELKGKKVVVIGAGGAGKAIAFTFAQQLEKLGGGGEIVVFNRTVEKAVEIKKSLVSFNVKVKGLKLNELNLKNELKDADILINATSVGMYPEIWETPVNKDLIKPNMVVFDLIYEPLKTRLLSEAREKGAKVVKGIDMLVYQAAKAFEIWFEREPPTREMFKVVLKNLQKD
ncbi:MAG: shikimate dehydrogenase [Candidatus Bathyarchaeota archaeon]|nr:shikimate dehydrogenase [Candidatus Bathyarchaeota archaeon]